MLEEGFLRRWSRRKTESRMGQETLPEPLPEEASPPLVSVQAPDDVCPPCASVPEADAAEPVRPPTLDDVAALTPESDFSGFVARGVDQAVRRSALKKLFADPHFNTMDGLDIYIDDYNKPSPLSGTMLASLRHAARLFERVAEAEAEAEPDAPPAKAIDDAAGPCTEPEPEPDSLAHPQRDPQQHPPETETR